MLMMQTMTSPQRATNREERRALLQAFARGIRPQPVVSPVEWGKKNFVIPVGPHKSKLFDLSRTPYVAEPLEMLRVDSPWTKIAVMKSGQTGFSTIGLVWLLCMIATSPDDMMLVQPSLAAAKDFNSERLDPAIKECRPLRKLVRPQRSRDADGSKTLEKKFPGGRLVLTGANSATDLSAKTVRFGLCDEIDRWPLDLDGQGDPMELFDARQISFTRTGTHKKAEISTPTNKGTSRIDKSYLGGDQRKWFMPCPHCGQEITFEFAQMRGADEAPYDAHYIAQCCGTVIHSWQQREMVLAGHWVATQPGPGRYPSYFINSLSSLLTSWDEIWKKYLGTRGDALAEKGFVNLWLGQPHESQAVEVEPAEIAKRAEDYPRGVVPARVGRLTFVVDTQDDRFEWALWGFGPASTGAAVEQWLIDAGVIDGDLHTDTPWDTLEEKSRTLWPHAGGKAVMADICGIDTGGHHTQRGYQFVWRKSRWRALKGSSSRDAIELSTPRRMEVKNKFGRLLFRVPLYFVGTFDLKVWVAHALKHIELDKPLLGGLRLTREVADERYIEQLSGEVLVLRERQDGRGVQEWKKFRANEALDLAVYARALAFGAYPNGMGVDRIDQAKWAEILAERHGDQVGQVDLFGPQAPIDVSSTAPQQQPEQKLSLAQALKGTIQ